ncbi:hypothetical protein WUBG_06547 [Wuchereria bancrofti]|uniref:Uncharacterized protein n=1 Tax=Wuchereria bancrofti TaxID=6293 RepID=J9F5D9_WUCBA|nr:hypothetical protein WUBG_06547 [Wuchereria bancrofti]
MDKQLQKFIQDNSDIRSTVDAYPEQQLVEEVTSVSCDVDNVVQVEVLCDPSLSPPNEACSLAESKTKEENLPNMPKIVELVELVDRPSSQLSTRSEQNPWQTRKQKNKKRKRNRKSENLDEPLYGFRVLANLRVE